MASETLTLRHPERLAAAGALCAAAVIGVALATDLVVGVALVFALLFAPIAFFNLPLAIALWVPLVFLEGLPGGTMIPEAGGIVIVGAWLGVAAQHGSWPRAGLARMQGQLALVLALLAWLTLSIVWARYPATSAELVISWIEVAAFFVVVATALSSPAHLKLVCWAFVIGAVMSVTIGAAGQIVGLEGVVEEGRFQAAAGDPNYLGAQLLGAIAIALGLLSTVRSSPERALLAVALLPLVYGLVASQSRGAFVAGTAMLVVALAVFARHRIQVAGIALVVVALLGAALAANPDATERLAGSGDRGSGRTDLWTVGWRMSQDHPILGVGLANFGDRAVEYTREPGQLENVAHVLKGQEAHNLYFGLYAETGLPGLALFVAVAVVSLRSGLRAAARLDALQRERLATLVRAAVVGLMGMLMSSFFLPNGTDKRMWILLAVAPAALGIADRIAGRTEHAAMPQARAPALGRPTIRAG